MGVLFGDCPTEPDCASFAKFATCDGCQWQPVKREVDWRPKPLTQEAWRIEKLIDEGLTVNMADMHPLVVEAFAALSDARRTKAQRDASAQAREHGRG